MNRWLDPIPFAQRSLSGLLKHAAAATPDKTFLTWEGRDVSLAELDGASDQIASGLRARNVGAMSRVAVMMDNSLEYMWLWFALSKLGAVEVPINSAYRGPLLLDQLIRSRAQMAVVGDAYAARFAELRSELPSLTDLIVARPADGGGPVRSGEAPFSELLGNDEPSLSPPSPGDLGCIIFTSGTTGVSKGVMLSHHHELSFGAFYSEIVGLEADGVVLNYLPHFHIAGKFLSTACLFTGARMILTPRLQIDGFWDATRRHGITNFLAVGGVCSMLYGKPLRADDFDNPVEVVYAVPAPPNYESFQRRFGVKLVECYGSTETNLVLYTDLECDSPGSCGRVNPAFEVQIVDEHDCEVPVGQPGEIVVRPRFPFTTMAGYDAMADRTLEAWRNMWFHTGDRARRDAEGYHWFLDRIKDSIRRRGENISSYEVERLVAAHPAVAEVAAVAVASALGEEEIKVVVVCRDGEQVDHDVLFRFCAESMPYFMVPRYIEFAKELERTPTNKVEKYKLREAGVTAATWDAERAGLRASREGLIHAPAPVSG